MKQMPQGKPSVHSAKKVGITGKEPISLPEEAIASHKVETVHKTQKGDITMEEKKGFGNFDAQIINENALKMTKFSMDKTFDTITKVQELSDKIIKDTIKTNQQMQADTEKLVGEWIEEGKKGWGQYRKVVEEGYKKFEALLVP